LVSQAIGGAKNNLRTLRQSDAGEPGLGQLRQRHTLVLSQYNLRRNSH
jgi:hypothetical protein